jgi:hypothetical protein
LAKSSELIATIFVKDGAKRVELDPKSPFVARGGVRIAVEAEQRDVVRPVDVRRRLAVLSLGGLAGRG